MVLTIVIMKMIVIVLLRKAFMCVGVMLIIVTVAMVMIHGFMDMIVAMLITKQNEHRE